ncbi:hypothetical protein V6N13_067411 [Hibiscus sabdariffa]|uniref:Uncharacterized protein n=1 Tax=Hibiscus sabdariffa TaxID=183260 RepID=A0ABR2DTR2_9ROSI
MDTNKAYNINSEDSEESLSFRFDVSSPTFRHSPNSLSHDRQLFEFSFVSTPPLKNNRNHFVFGGKLIKDRDSVDGCEQNKNLFPSSSAKSNSAFPIQNFRSQSVKQPKALIGVTKIPQRMELSDLRKRQSKGNRPLFMFPPADDGCGVDGKRCRLWSLLKPSRCRDHSFSSLSKASLGYIPNL